MEDRETARMRKYGEIKMTRIMMATVPHVTSGSGLRKFQAYGFFFDRVYLNIHFRTPSDSLLIIVSCEADFALKPRDQLS